MSLAERHGSLPSPAVARGLDEVFERLTWTAFEFEIEAVDPLDLPERAGSTIRGAFGRALRSTLCLVGPPPCSWCAQPETCLYQKIFEARTPSGAEVLSRNSHVSPPYAIFAPRGGRIPAGSTFSFRLTLVGEAADHAVYSVAAFRQAESGGLGRGRGRFRVAEVRSLVPGGPCRLVYDGRSDRAAELPAPAPALGWTAAARAWRDRELEIEFLTPTDLREHGGSAERPDFLTIVKALVRRVTTLSHFHGGGPARVDVRPWLEEAARVEIRRQDLGPVRWRRWSSRQGRWVPMGGVVGRLAVSPVPEDLAKLLAAGEHLQIGKGTTSGQGAYRVCPHAGGER